MYAGILLITVEYSNSIIALRCCYIHWYYCNIQGFIAVSFKKSAYCYKITLLLSFSNCNSTAFHQCFYTNWYNPWSARSATSSLYINTAMYIGYPHHHNYFRLSYLLLQQVGWQLHHYSNLIISKLQLYCFWQMLLYFASANEHIICRFGACTCSCSKDIVVSWHIVWSQSTCLRLSTSSTSSLYACFIC